MNRNLVACDGISVETLEIPPFQLNAGECLCMHVSGPAFSLEGSQLVRAFTGQKPVRGLNILGCIRYAEPPRMRTGLFGYFYQPRVMAWLRQSGNLADRAARVVLQRLGLGAEQRICQLAMNPRTLLSLEAAWARGAEGIVFTTVGCDLPGTESVFEAVAQRLDRCPAIYLSFPYVSNGTSGRTCFPGARCIELLARARQPAPLPSA